MEQDYTEEKWLSIVGYEGVYEVSNLGRIKSLPRGKQWPYRQTHNNIRKPHLTNKYYSVNLSKNGKTKWHLVHRLVAMAFLPNPDNLPCINHKDENRLNNFIAIKKDGSVDFEKSNLEWCSYKYNANYGTGIQRQAISRKSNPNDPISRKKVGEMNSKPVRQLTPDGIPIAEFKSMMDASAATGVHISTIIRHCKGYVGNDMGRKVRKFIFEYI